MDQRYDPNDDRENEPGFTERRARRLAIDGATTLRSQNWCSVEVKVQDLSSSGFMAECSEPVRIGSYVSLDVPGVGPVHAQVRWQVGSRMGGMFLDPISLQRCEWAATKAPAQEVPA